MQRTGRSIELNKNMPRLCAKKELGNPGFMGFRAFAMSLEYR